MYGRWKSCTVLQLVTGPQHITAGNAIVNDNFKASLLHYMAAHSIRIDTRSKPKELMAISNLFCSASVCWE